MADFFSYKNGELFAEEVSLTEIARSCGTPCYVYSQAAVEYGYDQYAKVLRTGPTTICYAIKANSNQALLRILAKKGAGADVVSEGELQRALRAGIPAHKIVFSGTGKEEREIRAALEADILQINIESESEYGRIAGIARTMGRPARIAFRINPDIDAKTHAKISTGHGETKFGVDPLTMLRLYEEAVANDFLLPQGLALHIGSQITSLDPYLAAWRQMADLARSIRARGWPLLRLDAGGGLGISYKGEASIRHSDYADALYACLGDFPLIVEPGRSIVGPAGILLTRLSILKRGLKKNFAILDAGMGDLLRPALYDAWHDILPIRQDRNGNFEEYEVVGPICETGDIFAADRKMPALQEGDLLAIQTAGAYGAVMSSEYNSRPMIPEILVRGQDFSFIRPRQTIAQMIDRDILPNWL